MIKRIFSTIYKSIVLSLLINTCTHAVANMSSPELIIIGSGVSGLRAGEYLKSRGFNNFIILEGRDHIGGRTYTYHDANSAWRNQGIDLGASWVHGAGPYNPLTYLVEKKIRIPYKASNEKDATLYDWTGKPVSAEQEAQINKRFERFSRFLRAQQGRTKADISTVSDAVKAFIAKEHLNEPEQAGLLYLVSEYIEQEYAADIKDLSWSNFDSDESFRGPELFLTGGYSQLVNYLARDLKNQIIMNQKVATIDYSQKNQVSVTTTNGTVYHAKTVISTLPIGVLKKGAVKFIPDLPDNKKLAMSHINMGVQDKIWLKFPKVFWDDTQFIERVAKAHLSKDEWVNKGRFIEFDNMNYALNQPILLLMVSGDFAKNMEHQSDAQILSEIMSILKKIYGDKIPQPIAHKITRWGQDEFAYGSYSSLRPGARAYGLDFKIMSKPIDRQVFFAGEATHPYYPATVHGAYLSGEREAKRFLHENIGTVRDVNNSVSGFTYYRSGDLTTWGEGNYGFDLSSKYSHFKRTSRDFELPVSVGYGINDNWDMSAFLSSYNWVNPIGERSLRGMGDLGFGTRYVFYNVAHSNSDIGFDLEVSFPTGAFDHRVEDNIIDGFIHYTPSVIAGHNMFFANWDAQIYAQIGIDLTSRVHSSYSYELDEGALTLEGPTNPRRNALIFNTGVGLMNDYYVLTAEYNYENSKLWSNEGNFFAYITPGIKFLVNKNMTIGLGAPIGISHDAADYNVIATLAYQFEPSA